MEKYYYRIQNFVNVFFVKTLHKTLIFINIIFFVK